MSQSGPPQPNTERGRYSRNMALAVMTANVGCLTVLITLAAMFAGLWLDNRFGTKPWFTIGFMGISLPISLFVMFFVARWTTSKMTLENIQTKPASKKGNDLD